MSTLVNYYLIYELCNNYYTFLYDNNLQNMTPTRLCIGYLINGIH